MIPKQTVALCDFCAKPITPTAVNPSVSLQPLRGGMTLVVNNGLGTAGQLINQATDFCNADCFGAFTVRMVKQIKVVAPPANTVKPAAYVASATNNTPAKTAAQ